MAEYVTCKHENGFFLFDTIAKYQEDVADEILDEFVKQDLEAIIYKTSEEHQFQVTGRIKEEYVRLILNTEGDDPVIQKMNAIKKVLEHKIQEVVFNNMN
jgi:REP element-mobilizing transposase RayT